MRNPLAVLATLIPLLLALPSLASDLRVTEALTQRVRVLYLAQEPPLDNYPQLEFLERSTDLRFIYQRRSDPEGGCDEESAQITDGVLWDEAGWPAQRALRLAALDRFLARRQFEAIVLEGKKFRPETAQAIADYVRAGGHLVWLHNDLVTEGPLAELCPFVAVETRAQPEERVEAVAPDYPLTRGLPLEVMFGDRLAAVGFAPQVTILAQTAPTKHAVLGIMPVGKGEVLALNLRTIMRPIHQHGAPDGVDSDFLWAQFWQQVGRFWKQGQAAYPAQAQVSLEPSRVKAGEPVSVEVKVNRRGAAQPQALALTLADSQGRLAARQEVRLAHGQEQVTAQVSVPAWAESGKYRLTADLLGERQAVMHQAFAFVDVAGRVKATLASDKPGYAVGDPVRLTAQVSGSAEERAEATLTILDGMGVPVHLERKRVILRPEQQAEVAFSWAMPDYGPEGWAFRAFLTISDVSGRRVASADKWFWRYQPYTFREKFLFNNWWGGCDSVPASLMPLYVLYHRSIGYNGGMWWGEPYFSRFNMRAWYPWSATVMENFTNNFTASDFSQEGNLGWIKQHMLTAAYVLHDFGEETGFYYHWSNNPCQIKWKNDEDIPEGGHRFFRMYLQEKYGTIANLNEQWETNYGSFEEIKLQSKWGRPAGWLFLVPAQDVPDNIAPYLDAHGFFFWYCRKAFEASMEAVHSLNPTPDWGMSFSLTFNLFSPVPMTQLHPVYHGTLAQAWNAQAVARSRGGNTPLFSFHWGFDEDYPSWGQFWNQNLACLATMQSNWGGQFNYDLTHSRSTLYLKRLMAQVRPREQFFLSCYPVEDYSVGIYHLDLDWQVVHSRPNFYLKPQGPKSGLAGQMGYKAVGVGWLGGPEAQVYNALAASGYTPRWVTEEEIGRCRVLFVPYVETMPESAAAAIRAFVEAGGTLVTLPVLASHNGYGKPYPVQPGGGLAEVLGLTVQPGWIGPRNVLSPPRAEDSPFPWRFTPRPGGEPCYLWSVAHQVVTPGPETRVIATHDDGNPAVTWHRFGQGQAIHLNWYTLDEMSQYEVAHFQNESLRQWLDNLVRQAGVTPPLFVERPLLYGEGLPELAQYQYRLKDSNIRVLALFNDKTNPRVVAQVVLDQSVAEVWDILRGERTPLHTRTGADTAVVTDPFSFEKTERAGAPGGMTFPVVLGPGEVALYALVPYHCGAPAVSVTPTRLTAGEAPLTVSVRLRQADGAPIPGSHPVHIDVLGPDGQRLPMLCRKATLPAEGTVTIPTRLGDPAGKWTVRVADCISGLTAQSEVTVAANPQAAQVPPADDLFYPSSRLGKIAVSDEEFVILLGALRDLYLSGGDRDKGSLSYYVHDRDLSRHRIMKLLGEADWVAHAPALRRYLEAGNTVILLGEDLGVDPATGLWLDPLNGQPEDDSMDMAAGGILPSLPAARRLEALEKVTGRDLHSAPWPQGLQVIAVGKGRLILDLTSFDNRGMDNGLFALNHARWLKTLPQ